MDLENLSESDAQTIASDPANEFHERLYSGDSAVKAAVEKAFAKASPERQKSIDESQQAAAWTGAQSQPAEAGEQAVREQTGAASNEPSPVDKEVHRLLSAQWGEANVENAQAAGEVLRSVFPSVEKLVEFCRAHGLENDPQKQVEILDLLAKLGRRGR